MAPILSARAILGWLAAGITLAACSGGEPARPRPDVLLLVIDTLRADRLGCYGYGRPTSPNLDRLAAEGVLFERASAQSSWTLPSMSSMLAGKYLTAHRARPDPDHALLAESFDAAGYTTIGIVANTLLRAEDGFGRGFDHYYVCGAGKTSFEDVLHSLEACLLMPQALTNSGASRPPLFLYVHAFDPHMPYERHLEYDAELPARQAPPVETREWQQQVLAERGKAPPPDDPEWATALADLRHRRGRYDQEVRYSDEHAGKLLRRLEELGLREKLIVAVVSDHGEGLWEQVSRMDEARLREAAPDTFFFGGHGQDLSEQALRTPFLLQGPGLPRGARIAAPVENIDLFPTLLHLADMPLPGDLHGRDLVPLIEGRTADWRDETFSFVIHSATVRDEKTGLKLVLPTTGTPVPDNGHGPVSPQVELYDLAQDPLERVNLESLREDDALRLMGRLQSWIAEHPTRKSTREENDPELMQRLEEHGYAGSLVDEEEEQVSPDPPPPGQGRDD